MVGLMFEGAKVGVAVLPDTRGFASELNMKLRALQNIHDLKIPANFDPDTGELSAALNKYANKSFNITGNIKPNTKPLDAYLQKIKYERPDIKANVDVDDKKMREQMLRRTYKVKVDPISPTFRKQDQDAIAAAIERRNQRTRDLLNDQYNILHKSVPLYRNIEKATRDSNTSNNETVRLLNERLDALKSLRDAAHQVTPFGGDRKSFKDLNDYINRYEHVLQRAKSGRITYNFETDGYAKVLLNMETVAAKAKDLDDTKVRVKFWTDGADRITDELNKMRTRMINIPQDLMRQADQLAAKYRDVAEKVRKNPDFKYEANLDLDTTRAKEEFEHFKRKHNELEIDAEIESLGASAHLAYLTRPRTVNIFARVRDTNLGKILSGATYGATGLQGVVNQFDRLANVFDKLDRYVPRIATIGSILGSITAGGINLAGSISAIGVSLGVMSKGLLAAPALLGAFGSAMWLLWGSQQKGAYKFDWTTTELGGLRDKGLKSFWDGITPKLREMANQIAPTINEEFLGIATAYGKTAGSILDMVSASDKMGVLPKLLANTRQGVENLGTPLGTLTQAFLLLGDQTSAMFPRMVSWLNIPATAFKNWVSEAEKSGAVVRALNKVAEQGSYLKSIFFDFGKAMGRVFTDLSNGQNGLEQFANSVGKFKDVVYGVKFTETIKAWVDGAKQAQTGFRGAFSDAGTALYQTRNVIGSVFKDMGSISGGLLSTISQVLGANGSSIKSMSQGVADGFKAMFDAVKANKSVLGDFFTMIGSLSRTFGTTLAASLKAAAPLLSMLAKAATAVADAVSKIPEPVLGMIGLWETFGKGGLSAFNMLKQGLAEHLVQLANYRLAMTQMNATEFAGGSMSDMLAAWGKQQLAMRGVSKGATEVAEATATAGLSMAQTGSQVGKTTGFFGKMKLAGSGLIASLGGLSGILTTGLVGAGIAAAGMAWSSYAQHTSEAKKATDEVVGSLGKLPSAVDAAKGLDSVGAKFKDNLLNGSAKSSTVFGWINDYQNGFKSQKENLKTLGISADEMGKSLQNVDEYRKMQQRLNKVVEDGTTITHAYGSTTGQVIVKKTEEAKAASVLLDTQKDNLNATLDQLEADAKMNGQSKVNVRSLYEQGASYAYLYAKTRSSQEQQEMLFQAQQKMVAWHDKQAQAFRNVDAAGVQYAQTLESLSTSVEAVKDRVSQGDGLWDNATNSLNYFSQAGRIAQQSLGGFAETSITYAKAMVDAGKSQDVVTKQMEDMRGKFIETAESMGLSGAQAQELATQYGLVPSDVTTWFKTEMEESKLQLMEYVNLISPLLGTQESIILTKAVTDGTITDMQTLDTIASASTRDRTMMISLFGDGGVIAGLQAVGLQAELSTDGKTLIVKGENEDALNKLKAVNGASVDPKTGYVYLNKDSWNAVKNTVDLWSPAPKWINVGLKAITGSDNLADFFAHRATGGLVTGSGTSTSDSIPTLLSNGEYVLKASAVKKLTATYGSSFLNRVNQTGSIPTAYARELQALVASSNNTANVANMKGTTIIVQHDDKAVVEAIDRTRTDVVDALTTSNVDSTFDSVFGVKRFNEAVYAAQDAHRAW